MQDYERKHLRTLRRSLAECTVLLKKDGSFPLEGPCSRALYGSGARHTVKGGTGSGEVNSRFFITAERGFEKTGFRITTGEWLEAYDRIREKAGKDFLKEIRARARKNHTMAIIEGMGAVMPEPEYDLPCMGIEKEYVNTSTGQLRTRFQAFVEALEMKKLAKEG